jgi:hypothetical protein
MFVFTYSRVPLTTATLWSYETSVLAMVWAEITSATSMP